jgi:hypothetical protein
MFLTQVGGYPESSAAVSRTRFLNRRSSSTLCSSKTANMANSTHSPASSAGAVASRPHRICRPLRRTSKRRKSAASAEGCRSSRHTKAHAMAATSSRLAIAAPLGCFQCSTCCPALLSSLNSDSVYQP